MRSHPVLLGDIGGTNARFAVQREPHGPVEDLPKTLTAAFPDPAAAIAWALEEHGGGLEPRSALLAVAAPVEGPAIRLTNAAWTVDAGAICEALGLDSVALVNDYTPVAAALAVLDEGAGLLTPLGDPRPRGDGPRLVLGPGTGLGAAALVPAGDRWIIVQTEAGHVEFGPSTPDETELWSHVERVGSRITAETILSGPGLARLYHALAVVRVGGADRREPADICAAGLQGDDAVAAETLERFAALLGRFAGDLALAYGAKGGVHLGSGIAPRILDVLRRGGFRAAFDAKAPHEALMRGIPTYAILHPEPALLGLAAMASDRDAFVFHHVEVRRA